MLLLLMKILDGSPGLCHRKVNDHVVLRLWSLQRRQSHRMHTTLWQKCTV